MDHSLNASEVFNKLADLYQARYMDVSAYATELDQFIQLLPEAPSVLEIACGPANLTKYILDRKGDARITGIDLAPKMIELARLNCPGADFLVMDGRNISSIEQKFDGIAAGFCLPYFNAGETPQLIKDMANLLRENGKLYLSTIEGSYEKSGFRKGSTGDEVFMYYYEAGQLEEWLSAAGFRIVLKNKVLVSSNPHQDVDLVIVAERSVG